MRAELSWTTPRLTLCIRHFVPHNVTDKGYARCASCVHAFHGSPDASVRWGSYMEAAHLKVHDTARHVTCRKTRRWQHATHDLPLKWRSGPSRMRPVRQDQTDAPLINAL